ncbi:hypothetical protein [Acinetobacter phage ABPH49]|nr:hypothetical protein [Acinetobacter phage ABPH49]
MWVVQVRCKDFCCAGGWVRTICGADTEAGAIAAGKLAIVALCGYNLVEQEWAAGCADLHWESYLGGPDYTFAVKHHEGEWTGDKR